MLSSKANLSLTTGLLLAVLLWGGNNVGVKYLVAFWPPFWVAGLRFLGAGLLMLALLRWTNWLGRPAPVPPQLRRALWWRGALSLAVCSATSTWAMQLTSASHVALYLGTAPVWALLYEGRPEKSWRTAQRFAAAALALAGVVILFAPALRSGRAQWLGELLGLCSSLCWSAYGRACRTLGAQLSGAQLSACTIWRAAVLLLPFAAFEIARGGLVWRVELGVLHAACTVGGGVVAYVLWNHALTRWPASQVYLFNNLIPVSTMTWSHFCLGEPLTRTFGLAMGLIVGAVVLSQARWEKLFGDHWAPAE